MEGRWVVQTRSHLTDVFSSDIILIHSIMHKLIFENENFLFVAILDVFLSYFHWCKLKFSGIFDLSCFDCLAERVGGWNLHFQNVILVQNNVLRMFVWPLTLSAKQFKQERSKFYPDFTSTKIATFMDFSSLMQVQKVFASILGHTQWKEPFLRCVQFSHKFGVFRTMPFRNNSHHVWKV